MPEKGKSTFNTVIYVLIPFSGTSTRQRVIVVHAGFHTPGIALKSPEGRNRIGRIVPCDTSFAQSPGDVAGESPIPRDIGS